MLDLYGFPCWFAGILGGAPIFSCFCSSQEPAFHIYCFVTTVFVKVLCWSSGSLFIAVMCNCGDHLFYVGGNVSRGSCSGVVSYGLLCFLKDLSLAHIYGLTAGLCWLFFLCKILPVTY